jgi:hypothetical protein
MALVALDGPYREATIGNFFTDIAKDVKKVDNAVSTDVKKAVKAVSTAVQKITKDVVVVGAAPARAAALLIIESDALGLAKSLAQAWAQDKTKVDAFWTGLGGNTNDLKSAIEKGSKMTLSGPNYSFGAEKSVIGSSKHTHYGESIGADLGTEIAVPIIKAIQAFLLAMGIPIPPEIADAVEKFIAKSIDAVAHKVGVTTNVPVPANASAGFHTPRLPMMPILLAGAAAVTLGFFLLND